MFGGLCCDCPVSLRTKQKTHTHTYTLIATVHVVVWEIFQRTLSRASTLQSRPPGWDFKTHPHNDPNLRTHSDCFPQSQWFFCKE